LKKELSKRSYYKIKGNYSVVSKALYLGILKNLKIEFLTKKLKNNYFLALLE
jgi:K+ transporter